VNFAFAGTPDFAAWVLHNLAALGQRPAVVISQPDRQRGRGCKVGAPPAVAEAARLGIDVVQTEDINSPAVTQSLEEAKVSTLLVASFGQMLRRSLLDRFLCVNIHTSLLPAYRGAAPIERALAAGESGTGVSIMRITEPLDEGPCALQIGLTLSLRDDAGSVGRALGVLGAIGASQVLTGLADGTVRWTEQSGPASYAHKLTARDCVLDPFKGAKAVHDQVRSLSPSIGARTASGAVGFKVWRTWPYGQPGLDPVPGSALAVSGRPGKIVVDQGRLFIGCGEGVIELLMVQPAGRSRMATAAFLRGYRGRLAVELMPGVEPGAEIEPETVCDDPAGETFPGYGDREGGS